MPTIPLSVQLYSVRDLTERDFAGAMKKVASIGYRAVELAGYGNLTSAVEVHKALHDHGLTCSGAHVSLQDLDAHLDRVMDEQDTLGNKNLVLPWLDEAERQTLDQWRQVAHRLETLSLRAARRGFSVLYHNHAFEFERVDGRLPMDLLLAEAPSVKLELDLYWVKYAGLDPLAYLAQQGTRIQMLHLKDMASDPLRQSVPVGDGTIDFASILSAGRQLDVQWYVVEQESEQGEAALESIARGYQYLQRISLR